MYTRRSPLPAILWSMLAVLLTLALAAFLIWQFSPRVTAYQMAEGQLRPEPLSPLTVLFSQPMRADSVPALEITPRIQGRYEWLDHRTLRFSPIENWPPNELIQVSIPSSARSQLGLPFLQTPPTFTVRLTPARVLYIETTSSKLEAGNIFSIGVDGLERKQMTAEPLGINGFDLNTAADHLIYMAVQADDATLLREMALRDHSLRDIFTCPASEPCARPQYAPDGVWVLFERANPTRLALVNLQTGETRELPSVAGETLNAARWIAPAQIGLLNLERQQVGRYFLNENRLEYADSLTLDAGAWSTNGQWMVFNWGDWAYSGPTETAGFPTILPTATRDPAITDPTLISATALAPATPRPTVSQSEIGFVNLFIQDLTNGISANQIRPLTNDPTVQDYQPTFSRAGNWLAFSRRQLLFADWTPGAQLWIIRPDGSGAQPLTNDPTFNHANVIWSPNERQLVFLRFNVLEFGSPPEVWIVNRDGSGLARLATAGFNPVWMP